MWCRVRGAEIGWEGLVTFGFVASVSTGQQGEEQAEQQNQEQRQKSAETQTNMFHQRPAGESPR